MPAQHQEILLPADVLKVSRLNDVERTYIKDHIGESRRVVDKTPPPRPAIASACAFVLDRLRDEPPEVQAIVKERLSKSLDFDKVMDQRRVQFGYVDLTNIGVGTGIGQSTELSMFDVVLSESSVPKEGVDWASEFRAEGGGPVVVDPRALLENRSITCEWCTETVTGARATQVMGKHVKDRHRDKQTEWRTEILPKIKKAFETVEGMKAYAVDESGFAEVPAQTADPRVEGVGSIGGGTVKLEAKDV